MQKNAKEQLREACCQLQYAKNELDQAMDTVEKQQNKQEIQKALSAIESASTVANNAMQNYRD